MNSTTQGFTSAGARTAEYESAAKYPNSALVRPETAGPIKDTEPEDLGKEFVKHLSV